MAKKSKQPTNDEVAIEDLVAYERNARLHSETQIGQIKKSIAEFGFTNPLLVWRGNVIIGGHGRWEAAKELFEENPKKFAHLAVLPVRRCDHLTENQRKALVIADNKIAQNSTWDKTILEEELASIAEDNIDYGAIGYTDDEISNILEEDDFEVLTTDVDGESASGTSRNYLKIGSEKIPMTDEEKAAILSKLAEYGELMGSQFGFVNWLLEQREARKR